MERSFTVTFEFRLLPNDGTRRKTTENFKNPVQILTQYQKKQWFFTESIQVDVRGKTTHLYMHKV